MNNRPFAVFDIDGTLIRWQFFHAIVHELGKYGAINAADHQRIKEARRHWKIRAEQEGFRAYERVLVDIYLSTLPSVSVEAHDAAIETVYQEYRQQMFTFTRDLLRSLQAQHYMVFAISGSHEKILHRLAADVGFDDYIGAVPEIVNNRFTGNIDTPVHDKTVALDTLIKKYNLSHEGSVGVGDSESDIAMLRHVERPIAFNPSRGLFEAAKTSNWEIVIERKNMIYKLQSHDGTYILV